MTDLQNRLDGLSPAKRALLARLRTEPGDEREAPVPMSFAQEQLWFLQQLEPDSAAYTVVQLVPFEVRDLDALRRALGLLVDRHAVLRTRYVLHGEAPTQVIDATCEVPVAMTDPVGGIDEHGWLAAVAGGRFDLATGPVLRAAALRLDSQRWRVALAIHHIAIDGWSMSTLLRELRVAYDAHSTGRTPALPPVEVDYADYARAQRSAAHERRVDVSLGWWRTQLAGAPQLDLPTDRHRPARPTHRASIEAIDIDAATTAGLEELARATGASMFMSVLTGYALTLATWTGQSDVLIGCPSAGRDSTRFERVIGLFVNTVPVRVRMDGASGPPTFRELLRAVRQGVLDTVAHEEVPFARLVRELAPHRDPGVNPLFQTSLQLSGPRDRAATARSETRHSVAFDLQVDVSALPDGLAVHFAYDVELFDASTVRRIARTYRTLLAAAVAAPDVPITELELLDPRELAELQEWNATSAEVPDRSVHETVSAIAVAAPDSVAVADGALSLTYGELATRSTRLAGRLAALGARPERVVALVLPRGADLVVAQLAVLKAGAAFLPLDPDTPAGRVAAVLAEVAPVAVVTLTDVVAGVADVAVVRPDDPPSAAAAVDAPTADPTRLAYLIATSGSTGVPKLVAIEHRGLTNLTAWHRSTFGVTAADRVGFGAAVSFDASVWEVWAALTAGATLVVQPADVRPSPDQVYRWVADERITSTFVPTPVAEELVALTPPEDLRLRVLLTGADVLHRLPPAGLPFAFWNLYGPTEGTVVATQCRLRADDVAGAPPSIGTPIANVTAHVLDAALRPVPVGVVGQLYLGGIGLARGYHGDPAATAAAFTVIAGERRYRTGDLARRLPDGRLRFLGRADGQLKIRGVRVEIGDVVAQVLDHPAVSEAVVVPHERGLAAYVVVAAPVTPAELRAHAAERLPPAVVPATWTELDALPLTRHGKVDVARLPPPAAGVGGGGELDGPVELAVADLFAELLDARGVGPADDFFLLGGHSLLATRLVMRIKARLAVELALRTMFENSTVRGLAAAVEAARRAASAPDRSPLRPVDRRAFRAVLRADGALVVDDALRAALTELH